VSEVVKELLAKIAATKSKGKRITIFICVYLAFFLIPFLIMLLIGLLNALLRIHETTNAELFVLLSAVMLCVVGAGIWFTRGSSWAGTARPSKNSTPGSAAQLRAQMLALNDLDLPFTVKEKHNGDLIAQWQIVNAKWADLMQDNGLEKQHTITLRLCEKDSTVRVIEEDRTIAWSTGIATLNWSLEFFRGIVFYQYERGAQFGLIYKDDQWQLGSAYNYRFLDSEMRNPLMHAAIANGWTFRPVLSFSSRRFFG